jgi:hypothetical protein
MTTSHNDFQAAYDVSARLPFVTFRGNVAIALWFTVRRTWGIFPNISLLGGGLTFSNVVPGDSEIVTACKAGDLLTVRDLFLQKKAAPSDMSEGDRTLLYVSRAPLS